MLQRGTLTGVTERKAYDGPWGLPEQLEHVAAWGKYARGTGFGRLETTVSAYDADWRPTEQIPSERLGTAVCPDPFCALDVTARGHTDALDRFPPRSREPTGTLRRICSTTTGGCNRTRPTIIRSINSTTAGRRGRYKRWLIDKADLRSTSALSCATTTSATWAWIMTTGRVRRERQPEQRQGDFARRVQRSELVPDGLAARGRRLARRLL